MYLFQAAQMTALQWNKAFIKVLIKYANYTGVFLFNLAIELSKNIRISEHVIMLVDGKQLSYCLIYTLCLIKLKALKAYIKTHLKTEFI